MYCLCTHHLTGMRSRAVRWATSQRCPSSMLSELEMIYGYPKPETLNPKTSSMLSELEMIYGFPYPETLKPALVVITKMPPPL